ncbi:MAG: multicopper oxidase domain-containing protein [Thermoproteota archaeon]
MLFGISGVALLVIAASTFAYFHSINGSNASNNAVMSEESQTGTVASQISEGGGSKRKEITLVAQDAEIEIAPGKTVKVWTFNGTMPAPTLRFTEGDNVTVKFINKTPIPHTIHFHGNHDDINDGVHPQIMPNETYLYNITAAPAGALMYHCHAHPTSLHIRMGMYGALIVDPRDNPLSPAREFVMVMSEYDTKEIMKFEAEYYPINGYADQYLKNPLQVNYGELVRLYVINIGTTIPYQFHLHSTTFKAYPSGLLSNEPIDAQTIPVGPGDATIVEAKWEYPGTYLFHSHGIQEERGNMGQIVVSENEGSEGPLAINQTISMFDWQYQLQKELQKPKMINYTAEALSGVPKEEEQQRNNHGGAVSHDNTTTFVEPTANATNTEIQNPHEQQSNDTSGNNNQEISIAKGAVNPGTGNFYNPSATTVKKGSTITWINNDSAPHTATAASSNSEQQGDDDVAFDSGIIGPENTAKTTINVEPGTYDYYCTLHPYMKGQLTVSQ